MMTDSKSFSRTARPLQGLARLFEPRDIGGLIFLRVGLGLVLAAEGLFRMRSDEAEMFYYETIYRFSYPGFGWILPLDERSGDAMLAGMVLLGLCFAAGFFYRMAAAGYLVLSAYFLLYDQAIYVNHYYLMWLLVFLMVWMPAHRAWSVDVLMRRQLRSETAPTWCWWLIRFQIALVYFFAGLVKLRPDWLNARPGIFMWLGATQQFEALQALPPVFMAYVIAFGGLAVDFFIAPFLFWRRTRLAAYLIIAAFHFGNVVLFSGEADRMVGAFPWLMLVMTTVFFDADWPRAIRNRLRGRPSNPPPAGRDFASAAELSPLRKAGLFFLGVYVIIQLALPLRFLFYPGNTLWTKEGSTYAWQMMSHHQYGSVKFHVLHPPSGKTWTIRPQSELSRRQSYSIGNKPALILTYAHNLADRFERQGYPDCEVRAETLVSLNGRPFQTYIDPNVDLANERSRWGHCPWVLPLEHDLPPIEEAYRFPSEAIRRLSQFNGFPS